MKCLFEHELVDQFASVLLETLNPQNLLVYCVVFNLPINMM
jgi:hypothetical protein